ncbi:unnamed protein product [Phytophthora fragariaefolia]|uniref:Unnamed protein product n=1 Tax=Phytophthora fragariaefolia TaxID=1490495 RepID=A0A9W6WIP3_9STRA|nr:unnamed protein product [Phytophthora fragariaefolia]
MKWVSESLRLPPRPDRLAQLDLQLTRPTGLTISENLNLGRPRPSLVPPDRSTNWPSGPSNDMHEELHVAFVQGTVTAQGADAAAARTGRGGSVQAPPTKSVVADSAHVEECAGVVACANKSGRVGTPTMQGVQGHRGYKVTSTPKAEASSRDADSAAEDRVPQVLDIFTGEPKVGEALALLPTVVELLELEELSYVAFLDSLKAGDLVEVVLLRPEGGAQELNSSSVMDSEVLDDEQTSKRQTRYGAAILKDPSDPYHPLLKEFSDVVSDGPPSVLPPDWGVRHEIDLVPGTNYSLPAYAVSNFAIGCALLQVDAEDRKMVVSFQSRQVKAAENNCPDNDKELLAMKCALVKFRVHLLAQKPFAIYTDHASLRTATSSPQLSLRMARWLSFFAEFNFTVEYNPGKQNVLADALSRRTDYELAHLAYLESPLYVLIREAYADDDDLAGLVEALSVPNRAVELTARQRSRLHRYSVMEGLLYYQVDGGDEPQIVVPTTRTCVIVSPMRLMTRRLASSGAGEDIYVCSPQFLVTPLVQVGT